MVQTHLAIEMIFRVDNAKVGIGGLIETLSSFNTEDPPTIWFHIEGKVSFHTYP
jgi:hypothetical protein